MPNYTITADKGAFTFTGIALTLGAGAFTFTGIAAGLEQGYSFDAEVGEFEVNKETAGFGSFVSSVPTTRMYVTASDDRYVSSSGAYVTLDILEGATMARGISPDYAITRVAMVENLNENDAETDTSALAQEAIDAVIELTGDIGSQYPGITTPVYLEKFHPELKGAHEASVKIMYRSYPLPEYEFDSGLGQIDTNIDYYGNAIQVSYTYPEDYLTDTRKAGKTFTQGGMVSMLIYECAITVHFTITAGYRPTFVIEGVVIPAGYSSAAEILTYLELFAGCVNGAAYNVYGIAGAARQWLVERVSGRSRDGGRTYQASMTLRFKPQGFEQPVAFINPDDGKPPADLVDGAGFYTPTVLRICTIPDFLFNNPNYWVQGEDWEWE